MCWAVASQLRGRGRLGDKGRVARDRGPGGRVDRGQLALALPAWRKAIVSARGRRVATFGVCYVLEGDGALNVFTGEHGRILPLYEYPDIRRGHGREGSRRGRRRVRRRLIWCVCPAS